MKHWGGAVRLILQLWFLFCRFATKFDGALGKFSGFGYVDERGTWRMCGICAYSKNASFVQPLI